MFCQKKFIFKCLSCKIKKKGFRRLRRKFSNAHLIPHRWNLREIHFKKCRFCGSNVIVPSDVFQKSDKNIFDDTSSLGNKAVKFAEIYLEIQRGDKINAIKNFRETFSTGLKEAKDAVEVMERGESVDISGMQIRTANLQTNAQTNKAVKKVGFAIGD